ncbi:MAG TPA: cupin domain-containing protein [Stellaceae bacterium]|nr:cupin domain-containing protein [Stellaceae bacterium]
MAMTFIWDCTAGQFDWNYDLDETIYFIEGSAIISDGHSPPQRFVAGDVLFLPRGAVAHWHVEEYVRKVAFCRRTQSTVVRMGAQAVRKLKRLATPKDPLRSPERDALIFAFGAH